MSAAGQLLQCIPMHWENAVLIVKILSVLHIKGNTISDVYDLVLTIFRINWLCFSQADIVPHL